MSNSKNVMGKKSLNNWDSNFSYKEVKTNMSSNFNRDVLFYLISKLGDQSEGRKKVMKMMFLVNHFDLKTDSLIKQPLLGENFIIYHYGVFSFDVMENFIDLSNLGVIGDSFPIQVKSEPTFNIPQNIVKNVDLVVEKFGERKGQTLELETLKMLGLDLETKKKHFGEPVTKFI